MVGSRNGLEYRMLSTGHPTCVLHGHPHPQFSFSALAASGRKYVNPCGHPFSLAFEGIYPVWDTVGCRSCTRLTVGRLMLTKMAFV